MNKLAEYLLKRGIMQRYIAEKIGVSQNTFSSWVKGKSVPSIEFAYLIEKATNGAVTVYDWVSEESKKNKGKYISET